MIDSTGITMYLRFATGRLEEGTQEADNIPMTLGELKEYYYDPDFAEETPIALHLTGDEERKIILNQYVLRYMSRKEDVEIVAKGIGLQLTQKDRKAGLPRMKLRMLEAFEKHLYLNRFCATSQRIHLKPEVRKKLAGMVSIEESEWEPWKQRIMSSVVDVNAIVDELTKEQARIEREEITSDESRLDHLVYYLFLAYLTGIALFPTNVYQHWRDEWLAREPESFQPLYHLFAGASVEQWLNMIGKRGNKAPVQKDEVAQLKQRQKELEAQYQADIETLQRALMDMQERTRKVASGEVVEESMTLPLAGKQILVVGDDGHQAAYRQLVELNGASFDFISGFNKNAAAIGRIQSADGIILVTAFMEHSKWYALKAHAQMEKVVLVNRAGIAAMEEGLRELGERIGGIATWQTAK